MADPIIWPSLLVPSSEDWSLRGGTRSGGQTFLGNEQVVASPTARWKATRTIPCMTRETSLAMRRIIALGRSVVWNVGPCENTRAPWNIDLVGGKITYGRAAQRPDVYIGDQRPDLDFKVAAAAATNATELTIQRNRGGVLEHGMMLSIGGRLHTIVDLPNGELADPGSQGPAGTVTIVIRPWLRVDVDAGTPVEFGTPNGLMRLASDDTGAMEQQLSRFSTVAIDLVEAF
ncbi:hypothetical protein [Methylobacterium sp. C1]|uniref:hypothetical protein n=1 Tax=Methylobacterium sp. C1 TaxID=1479019 RepID=UPI0008DAF139|nr:hypothetical protein [Methylobacterium sp. C1]